MDRIGCSQFDILGLVYKSIAGLAYSQNITAVLAYYIEMSVYFLLVLYPTIVSSTKHNYIFSANMNRLSPSPLLYCQSQLAWTNHVAINSPFTVIEYFPRLVFQLVDIRYIQTTDDAFILMRGLKQAKSLVKISKLRMFLLFVSNEGGIFGLEIPVDAVKIISQKVKMFLITKSYGKAYLLRVYHNKQYMIKLVVYIVRIICCKLKSFNSVVIDQQFILLF